MKKIGFIAILLSVSLLTSAQTEEKQDIKPWKLNGVAGINMSQVSLSNWAAGGENSIAFDISMGYSANYSKDKSIWDNRLELAYGLNNTKSKGSRKTNDKIYLSSNYGYKLAEKLYLSYSLTFETQFADGFDYNITPAKLISSFMAPAYLSTGPGLTWKPNDWITATLAPAMYKATFVLDERLSGNYGVALGEKIRNEFGGNLQVELQKELVRNITLYSRLNLFSNYLDKPQNIDIKWDNQFSLKVNKWFSAILQLNMIYDDDIKFKNEDDTESPRFQFKEILGIGIQLNF